MSEPIQCLVLGGKGFIGRHAVQALRAEGVAVTIGTRSPRSADEKEVVLHREMDWSEQIVGFDVVLNCVGILRQRWAESYETVHHLAPAAIARACRSLGVRFVHVSALGLTDNARSRFITSKRRGEEAIERVGEDWAIARLSLLDGEGGYGAAWLRGVAQLPFFIVPTSAQGHIAALTADDAGQALAALCLLRREPHARPDIDPQGIFELGGEHPVIFEEYIRGLRRRNTERRAICIRAPGIMARLFAHVCDVLHFSPFSFGHWELLCHDNVPQPNRLAELLGRRPERVI